MKTKYVLVDFENVQPSCLDSLRDGFRIMLFVGAKQKISVEVAKSIQAFGPDAEYIQVEGAGMNALDFHIAFYIGRLAAESADMQFYIVSKDTGFDPLIEHLRSQKIRCRRVSSVAQIHSGKQECEKAPGDVPAKNTARSEPLSSVEPVSERVMAVVARLGKGPKPRTEKTLRSFIKATFAGKLDEEQVAGVIRELLQKGTVSVTSQGQVSYAPIS